MTDINKLKKINLRKYNKTEKEAEMFVKAMEESMTDQEPEKKHTVNPVLEGHEKIKILIEKMLIKNSDL